MSSSGKAIHSFAASVSGSETSGEFSTFAGAGLCFGEVNDRFQIFLPTAFDDYLPDFLKHGLVLGLNHNDEEPIGTPIEASIKGLEFSVTGEINHKLGDEAKRTATLLSATNSKGRRVVTGLSLGLYPLVVNLLRSDEEVQKVWDSIGYKPTSTDLWSIDQALRRRKGPNGSAIGVGLVRQAWPYEISPVCFPAFWGARITTNSNPATNPGKDRLAAARLLAVRHRQNLLNRTGKDKRWMRS